jgi:tetratricopeptide (TPR) repeat protein
MNNYAQSLKDYSEAVRLDPKESVYYKNRGITYFNIENMNQAMIDFNKAIELNPKDAIVYKYRAEVLNIAGNYV